MTNTGSRDAGFLLKLIAVACALLTGGCVVGPDISPPTPPSLPPSYSASTDDLGMMPLDSWLQSFADPKLGHILTIANEQNLDIKQAYFRIVEARANLGVVRGGLAPTADLVSEYAFRKQSENARPFVGQNGQSFNLFLKGIDAAWQIDLFGKIQRSIEAAEADVSFNAFDRQFIRQTLLSDVSASYIRIRLIQDQLVLVSESLRVQEETITLVKDRSEAGVSTELDNAQTQSFVERTRTLLAGLQQQLDLEFNNLSVLLGHAPNIDLRHFLNDQTVLQTPMIPEVGFPANLLRNRPDVRREEMAFVAAVAEIGVAEADLYPQLSLIGNISVSAQNISSLFTTESLAFTVGPSFRWNILQFGRVTNNIEAARARCEQAHLNYQQTVLNSAREVEDSIAQFNGFRRQTESLTRAIAADERAVELSLERYKAGRANFQRVLDSQQQLLQDFQQRSSTRHQAIEQLVRLYNSLGGNWNLLASQQGCMNGVGFASDVSFAPSIQPTEIPIQNSEPAPAEPKSQQSEQVPSDQSRYPLQHNMLQPISQPTSQPGNAMLQPVYQQQLDSPEIPGQQPAESSYPLGQ